VYGYIYFLFGRGKQKMSDTVIIIKEGGGDNVSDTGGTAAAALAAGEAIATAEQAQDTAQEIKEETAATVEDIKQEVDHQKMVHEWMGEDINSLRAALAALDDIKHEVDYQKMVHKWMGEDIASSINSLRAAIAALDERLFNVEALAAAEIIDEEEQEIIEDLAPGEIEATTIEGSEIITEPAAIIKKTVTSWGALA
jgi:hypothetical protein